MSSYFTLFQSVTENHYIHTEAPQATESPQKPKSAIGASTQTDTPKVPVGEIIANVRGHLDIHRITPEEIPLLTKEDFRLFHSGHISMFDQRQVQALTLEQLSKLLSPYLLTGFTLKQLRWMSKEQRALLLPRLPADSIKFLFPGVPPEEVESLIKVFTSEQISTAIPTMTIDQAATLAHLFQTQTQIIENSSMKALVQALQPIHIEALFDPNMRRLGVSLALWRFLLIHLQSKSFKALVKQANRENKAVIYSDINKLHMMYRDSFVQNHISQMDSSIAQKAARGEPLTKQERERIEKEAKKSKLWKSRFRGLLKKKIICLEASCYRKGEKKALKQLLQETKKEEKESCTPAEAVKTPFSEGRSKSEIRKISVKLLSSYEQGDWSSLKPDEIRHLASWQVAAVSPKQLRSGWSDEQIAQLSQKQVAHLNPEQWSSLLPRINPRHLTHLIKLLPTTSVRKSMEIMSVDQISSSISLMSRKQIAQLYPYFRKTAKEELPEEKLKAICLQLQPKQIQDLFPKHGTYNGFNSGNLHQLGMNDRFWKNFLLTIPDETFQELLKRMHKQNVATAFASLAEMRWGNLALLAEAEMEQLPNDLQEKLRNSTMPLNAKEQEELLVALRNTSSWSKLHELVYRRWQLCLLDGLI